jgi:hypothetical protein
METEQVTQVSQEPAKIPVKKPFSKWILIVVGLVVIIALVFGAYFFGKSSQKTVLTPTPSPIMTTASPVASSTPTPTVTPAGQVKQTMLEVPELGVKFQLSFDINDAYVIPTTKSKDFVYLKVHSLDSETQCNKDESSTASISRVGKDEINPMADKKYSESYQGTTIGNYFYYIDLAQYACAESTGGKAMLEKVRTAFKNASSTIESL